jgi:hypothetical protein
MKLIIEQKNKTMSIELKKLLWRWVIAVLALAQMPVTLSVSAQINQAVPMVGDEANMVLWIVLFAIGLLGTVSILIKLIMNRRKQDDTPSISIEGDDDQEVIIKK